MTYMSSVLAADRAETIRRTNAAVFVSLIVYIIQNFRFGHVAAIDYTALSENL